MHKALYRKWRSPDFDDVCGQEAVTDILKYQVESGRLSHAYLFCGSRGTGKTSCAKILAKAVNCLDPKGGNPCNKCAACRSIDAGTATDVIEMDAASNNGVGDVRDMKDEIAFTPAELKYRVYIIDEVHMMSKEAFNALLKTLEEPPEYVIFILATTEYNKLPATIVSRCQQFDFKRLKSDVIVERLLKISSAEGIDITRDGAKMIARASEGGMRDAISMLELCAGAHRKIDAPLALSMLGQGSRETSYSLISAVISADYNSIYRSVADAVETGTDILYFWQSLMDAYRDVMIVKSVSDPGEYLDLTDSELSHAKELAGRITQATMFLHTGMLERAYMNMQLSPASKRREAEMTLLKMADPKLDPSADSLIVRVETLEKEIARLKMGSFSVKQEIDPGRREDLGEKPKTKQTVSGSKKASAAVSGPQDKVNANAEKWEDYGAWNRALLKIGEVKSSLAAQFIGGNVMRCGKRFAVYMRPFFASKILKSDEDRAILAGAIAETEGVPASEINIEILSTDKKAERTASDELLDILS